MSTTSQINQILKIIGKRGFDGISIQAKNHTSAIAALARKNHLDINPQKVASEIARQDLVVAKPRDNWIKLQLTPYGAYRLQKIVISELSIKTPKVWDGKWRMVTFDIPLNSAANRMNFTNQLHKLGLKMVQKSVWVYPYACLDEIRITAEHFNVWRYCGYFEISKTDQQTSRKLDNLFKLKK